MSTPNPFLSDKYTSDRNIFKHGVNQTAMIVARLQNEDEKVVQKNLVDFYKANRDEFKSRRAKVIIKNKNGDREVKVIPISSVLKHVQDKNYHFSPSMIGYVNSDEEECVNAIGTRQFIANRKFYKDKRQEQSKGSELYGKFNELQNAFKIFNNAQSGAMSSEGTPINNKTGHTSLTSSTRCLTSTANLINEQFIAGNRFYNTPENTLQSIMARLRVTNLEAVEKVMTKWNMHVPTVDEVMECVTVCSRRYWSSDSTMRYIRAFMETLNGTELASILYTLDLVSMFRYNRALISGMFDDYIKIPEFVEGKEAAKPDNGDRYTLCVSKLPPKSSKDAINQLADYHLSIESKYYDLFRVFFKSKIPPSALFDVTSSVRDCVLTSDTDSSIYTVDEMIDTYTDNKEKGVALNGVLTYFVRMISVDQHAQLSANMNVSQANINLLNMKNEYYFGAYITTPMSKHYYATQLMIEGVALDKAGLEIKGVHLKNSKMSADIKDKAQDLMKAALAAIEDKQLMDAADVLHSIGEMERNVMTDLQNGKWSWLSRESVKNKAVYKNPDSQIYLYHEMWETVFADKYGPAPELPYTAVKMSVDLKSKTKLNAYIESIEDNFIRERMRSFMESKNKTDLTNLYVPMERLQNLGDIPSEFKQAIDMRTVIKQNFKSVYAVLESTGLYFMNDSISRLVSDEH